jgi:hypothetical protein
VSGYGEGSKQSGLSGLNQGAGALFSCFFKSHAGVCMHYLHMYAHVQIGTVIKIRFSQ